MADLEVDDPEVSIRATQHSTAQHARTQGRQPLIPAVLACPRMLGLTAGGWACFHRAALEPRLSCFQRA